MLTNFLTQVRQRQPLVHCITNYITANDCANLLLACGASPIMADDPEEAAEITAHADALVLNLGTLHSQTLPAMLASGRQANALGLPVLLDPVGVGASAFRARAAAQLLEQVRFTAIRGNSSEIKVLARGSGLAHGADAAPQDQLTACTLPQTEALAQSLARRTGAVVALTGAADLVTDGQNSWVVRNGHPMMARVTGTGCQLSALTGAFLAASPQQASWATVAALCTMGLAGELAAQRLLPGQGNASYRTAIIDTIYHLTPEELEAGAKYEMQ